ncbi:MAG: hypothetical protein DRG59_07585 [Deltaproteobacteria bacterium]|nr:MAG: hypothetical protein DRG59_07585 [Deltaproteobacteria bacterium]
MAKKYLSEILERLRKALQQINTYTELTVQMTVEPYARGKAVLHFKKLKKDSKAISDEQENSSITLVDPQGVPVQNQVAADIQELFDLVPQEHQEKLTITNTIKDGCKKYGTQYVLRNIKYTNSHCKKNYRAFLIKALENDWGLELQEDEEAKQQMLRTQAEEAKKEEQKYEQIRRIQTYIRELPEKQRRELEMQARLELADELEGKNGSLAKLLIRSQMEQIILRKFNGKEREGDMLPTKFLQRLRINSIAD